MKPKSVSKAVIPVAGFGSRLLPQSFAFPKAMLPVYTASKRLVPMLQCLIEDLVAAGIKKIALIVSNWNEDVFRKHFNKDFPDEIGQKTKQNAQLKKEITLLKKISPTLTYIIQKEPIGLVDAIYSAEDWLHNERFLLVLGDHLFVSRTSKNCFQQLLDVAGSKNGSVLAVTRKPSNGLAVRGHVSLEPHPAANENLRTVSSLKYVSQSQYEKDRNADAKNELTEDLFCVLGAAILDQNFMRQIKTHYSQPDQTIKNIPIQNIFDKVIENKALFATEIYGESIEIGNPEQYRYAMNFMLDNSP